MERKQQGGWEVDWTEKNVLVTGGASFIGSHLVDALLARGVGSIKVVDDLTSGTLTNIQAHIDSKDVSFVRGDLLEPGVPQESVRGIDIVFHLAAIHGGRGFVDLHQAACAQNLALDGALIKAAFDEGVEKFVFASSGCVYPIDKQQDVEEELYLSEEMVGPPFQADGMYGWAKLMTEMTLRAYYQDFGFRSASCRFFTVYGERGVENHAVMAMIARAFTKQDPFEVWGDGTQVRNWTYVGDIVSGLVLAAERIADGSAVNLGTDERTTVREAVEEVLRYTGHQADIKYMPEMPTGPLNRVADTSLARDVLGWEYRMPFIDGLHRTIDWYFSTKRKDDVAGRLDYMLTER